MVFQVIQWALVVSKSLGRRTRVPFFIYIESELFFLIIKQIANMIGDQITRENLRGKTKSRKYGIYYQ